GTARAGGPSGGPGSGSGPAGAADPSCSALLTWAG
ncbi:MAG: hypothetical protein JWO60_1711, partial [Frankiales bacterium]|nr:hypothetical protein [Frankiales bacterium]